MANSVRIDLTTQCHSEGYRARAFIEHTNAKLTIHVRRGNALNLKCTICDLRNLAKELHRLADAVEVARGDKSVAP